MIRKKIDQFDELIAEKDMDGSCVRFSRKYWLPENRQEILQKREQNFSI